MKYFNVIFWVILIGLVLYFTIDSRDIKNIFKPIENTINDIIDGESPEEFLKQKISQNNYKRIQIDGVKTYYCDPNFSYDDLCNYSFSVFTYSGEGDVCNQALTKELLNKTLKIYGKGKEKSQESCEELKDELDNLDNSLRLEIEELELVLSEDRAREYVSSLDKVKLEEVSEPSDVEKFLLNKAKEKQKAPN